MTATAHDPTLTGRANTAALLEIAVTIAAGTTTAITAEAPPFLRAALPGVSDGDLNRVALLLSWGMYLQHTTTVRELARKWRIARTIGAGEDDALDFALAAAAELAEQRFAAWALDVPIGAAASSTDRFLSALAERIAQRVVARMGAAAEKREEVFEPAECQAHKTRNT